jgi:hypothetical protein
MKIKGLISGIALLVLINSGAHAQCCDPEDWVLAQQEAQVESIDVTGGAAGCLDYVLPYMFTGAEFSFLSVDARSGGHASLTLDDTNTAGTDLRLAGADSLTDSGYAPRVWLGCRVTDCWSVVGRYWHLDDSGEDRPEAPAGAINLANLLRLSGTSHVEAYDADLEVDRAFDWGCWKVDGTVGARHASLDVNSHLSTGGVFTSGSFANLDLSDGTSFEGTGVTYAIMVRRQLGNSHANFYFGARGSNLDGRSDSFGRASVAIGTGGASFGNSISSSRQDGNASLTIAELQAGIEYDIPLACVPAEAFFRVGYEFQDWNIDGRAAAGLNTNGSAGPINLSAVASPGIGDMQLNGVTLATGLTW